MPYLSARRAQTFLACAAQMVNTPQKAERLTVDVSGFWTYGNLVRAAAPAGLLHIQNPKQIRKAINVLWTTSLSGKGECPGKRSCTVTLVVSLNSSVYIDCFEIPRWEVLRKQKYYLLKLKALLFLYPQIFFTSVFAFMAIATSNYFSCLDLFFTKWNSPRQRICSI